MRRNIKNIRHKSKTKWESSPSRPSGSPQGGPATKGSNGTPALRQGLAVYEIPWDRTTTLKILAGSREQAEKVALNLVHKIANDLAVKIAGEIGKGILKGGRKNGKQ